MLNILHAEFFKFKGMFKRYYIDSIAEICSYIILFVGLSFTILNDSISTQESIFQLIVGIFIWYVGINSIAIFTFILQEEMHLGTLEQIYLTRTSLTKMLMGRAVSTFIFDAVRGLVLSFTTIFIFSVFSPTISLSEFTQVKVGWLALIIILLLTMIGIYGFAFILAGLSIVYKRISAITVILNYIFLFFTGITLNGNMLPTIFEYFSKLLPITWGIINIKGVINTDVTFFEIITSSNFTFLILNSIIYLILGFIIFKIMLSKAKRNGSLGHY